MIPEGRGSPGDEYKGKGIAGSRGYLPGSELLEI
jgi:hypothetical protein